MKKAIILASIFFSLSSSAQKVTDTVLIKMDTITFNNVRDLIRENVLRFENGTPTKSSILLVNSIILPMLNYRFLQPADKPKELKPKQ